MRANRFDRKIILRLIRDVVVMEAVVVAVSWLLQRYWSALEHFSLGDVLFMMGGFSFFAGSVGMMRSPYWNVLSPTGIWASGTQANETEKHTQLVDEMLHQFSFGMSLIATGVIAVLLSIPFSFGWFG